MLTVNAEYQRGLVWKPAQKKRLIDSVLRGYPISLIYLHHISTRIDDLQADVLEIIDGQQRIKALHAFYEGAFKLFDPVEDASQARFPSFIVESPCPWAGKTFDSLDPDTQERFVKTELPVGEITTQDPNEARDLFIRLQAGMPLNAQEKRDAWPGNFTEFILKIGGKPEIERYPGHEFYTKLMGAKASSNRGKFRQLAAQMAMLFLTRLETNGERLCNINSREIDDFYYNHLDFDLTSPEARRFHNVLDKLTLLLGDEARKKIVSHEAIHLMLLTDSLMDEYTRSWETLFTAAFDRFRENFAKDKLTRDEAVPGDFWLRYGTHTRVNSDREGTIRRRHEFFCQKMLEWLKPKQKDPKRLFGPLEREIIYYRDHKKCHICGAEVPWSEAEIHHLESHVEGGQTVLPNGVLVRKECHPR